MIELPVFCPDWHLHERAGKTAQDAYIASELRRLEREGLPVLTTVLSCGIAWCEQRALDMLEAGVDPNGEPVRDAGQPWMLRLVKDAKPPIKDPQGRLLPKEEQGKVLLVKVGNLGGDINLSKLDPLDAKTAQPFNGDARELRRAQQRDLYKLQRVTRTPTAVTLGRAVLVLRQWGVGVMRQRHAIKAGWKPGEDYGEGQDRWLVEEVVAGREDTSKAKASAT